MSAQTHERQRHRHDGWFPLGPPATETDGGVFVCECGRYTPHVEHPGEDVFGSYWCPGWPVAS